MPGAADAVSHARTERPWGWYDTLALSPGFKVKRIHVDPGRQICLQWHRRRAAHGVVVPGTARVPRGTQLSDLAAGQHTGIAVGRPPRPANAMMLPGQVIEVQCGDDLGEDGIVRLRDDSDSGRT